MKRHSQWVTGPENNVPCPWCAKHNDHTAIKEMARETGTKVQCDHCHQIYVIKRIDRAVHVSVAQYWGDEE